MIEKSMVKHISGRIPVELYRDFRNKLTADDVTANFAIEMLIRSYVSGKLSIECDEDAIDAAIFDKRINEPTRLLEDVLKEQGRIPI